MGSYFPASWHQSGWGRQYLVLSYFILPCPLSPVVRQTRREMERLSVSSTWSRSPTLPVEPLTGTMEHVTLPLSALLLVEQHQEPVLRHSECAVSSPSLVEEVAVLTTPTLSSLPTPPAQTATPASTHSVQLALMSAS